jgi:2-desacetyl-2-hydroxyethyl bacteriochlorophyllide A dehydrogenase
LTTRCGAGFNRSVRAVTFQAVERVAVADKSEPVLRAPGEVIVAVELAGLCGSDLHPYRGLERGLDSGTTMGHEFVGTVIEAGAAVRNLRVGDAVMTPFSTSCSQCACCRRGLTARCESGNVFGWVEGGRGLEGAQAERVRVPLADTTLIQRPPRLSALEALLIGDVVATGFAAVERIGNTGGEPLVVIGLGAVGLAAVLAARFYGFHPVVGLDSVPERLEHARELGAEPVTAPADPATAAHEVARVAGGDVLAIVEAVGSDQALQSAAAIAAPGGTISAVGVHTSARFPLSPQAVYDKNLTLRFGRCSARTRMNRLADLVAEGRLSIAHLVTHTFPLEGAPDAYQMFAARSAGCIKAVFQVSARPISRS